MTNFELSPRQRGALRTSGAILLAGSLISSCVSVDSQEPFYDRGAPYQYDASGCLNPSAKELAKTAAMLDTPEDAMVAGYFSDTAPNDDGSSTVDYNKFRAWQHGIAQELGSQIYDAPTLTESEVANHTKRAYDQTGTFLARYGIQLTMPQASYGFDGIDGEPINKKEFWSDPNTSRTIIDLLSNVTQYPADYFRKIGLTEVAFMKGDEHMKVQNGTFIDISGEVNPQVYPHTIFVDYRHSESNVLSHEAVHLLDFKEGCLDKDEQYVALNGGKNIYTEKPPQGVYSRQRMNELNNANKANPSAKPLSPANMYVAEEYSFVDSAEDKATLGTQIFNALASSCTSGSKILSNKLNLLFTRLRLKFPKTAEYFLRTSQHCDAPTLNGQSQ